MTLTLTPIRSLHKGMYLAPIKGSFLTRGYTTTYKRVVVALWDMQIGVDSS